jgi:hypothetical protein
MSAPALIARLTEALEQAAGPGAALVSLNVEMLGAGEAGAIEVVVARKTRTLVFLNATCATATAASVHKIAG